MEKTVTTISPKLSRFTDLPLTATAKRKVAAYARVSTDHEEQQSSYEAQVNYYTEYIIASPIKPCQKMPLKIKFIKDDDEGILPYCEEEDAEKFYFQQILTARFSWGSNKSRTDWEFAGIFADEGIPGCSIKGRQGSQAMIKEALNGGINLIITKSVSRFARNTVDSLSAIRKLKEHNVECYFEKENIWTFDSKCELMLSILSSISQEESHSISENVTWGHRRHMADGKVSVPFGRFLGYDRGEHGELIVNEKEAEVVREIYRLFLSGLTPHGIGKELTARHIPTPGEAR